MSKQKYTVPAVVHEGLLAVRDTGETNMFDYHAVINIALRMGYTEAAEWVSENGPTGVYAQWVFGKCEVVDNPTTAQ